MDFEWDGDKSDACLSERGFDFAYAASAFSDTNRLIEEDTRFVYGEPRFRLLGKIESRLFVVVYTLRKDSIRIISGRKANAREVRQYENRTNEN